MPEPEINPPDDKLQQLEQLAERLEPRKPNTLDLFVVGAVAVLFLAIGLALSKYTQLRKTPLQVSTPPSATVDSSISTLLGRYDGRVYYFSEASDQVLRYDPTSGRSESVFNLSLYQAHLWSPRGDKIAIISNQDNDSGDLYVINLSNPVQNPRPLAPRSESTVPKSFSLLATSPMAWSPDESIIAFIAYNNEISDIFAVKVDGNGQPWPITVNQRNITSIAWADDDAIAFVIEVDGEYKKFLINIDRSGLREWR